MSNLVSILRKRASKFPHAIAYIFLADGEQETAAITYGELDIKARAIASCLQDKKIQDARILLIYPAGIDFICAYLGCLYAGVIAVPVNCPKLSEFKKSESWLKAIGKNADITGVLTSQTYVSATNECFVDLLKPNNKKFVMDTTNIDDDISVMYNSIEIDENQIAYLQYSSGSTATPKAAIIQHKQLIHSLNSNAKIWQYTKNSITLTWASHAHVYGLVCGLLVPLYHGSKAIIMPTETFISRPIRWLEAITQYKVTHTGSPNFGYDLCIQEISDFDLVKLNLKSWKVAVNGGERVQQTTLEQFCKKFETQGFKINQFCSAYGSSELTGTIATSEYGKGPTILKLNLNALKNDNVILENTIDSHQTFVSSGRIIPGLEAVIINPNTFDPVEDGKIGELWLAGKSVANGYWNNIEATQKAFNAKLQRSTKLYFRTGDLGFIKNKEVFLTGRLKDLIVLYGKKYYPVDIEQSVASALKSLPISYKHVAFSLMVSGKEEVIFLQEVKNNITQVDQDKINNIIPNTIMKKYGINVHDVVLVKENTLPKTLSGKLQRNLCKQKYLDKTLDVIYQYVNELVKKENPSVLTSVSDARTNFTNLIANVIKINPSQIDFDAPLSHYKLDSIKIVQLANVLNEAYDLSLTPAIIFEYSTFSELLKNLTKQIDKTILPSSNNSVENDRSIIKSRVEDIAIIGVSGIFPGANDLDEFWNNLINGKDVITEIPEQRWDWKEYFGNPQETTDKTNIKWGGFVEGIAEFDAGFFNISPREAELTDPQQRIFIQTVWKTIEDAGYSPVELEKLKTGLFVGVFNTDYAELLQKNNINDAYVTTGTTHSILANRISYLFNFTGPSVAIDTACSSSLVALHHAVKAIHNGDCDVAIAGGVNALLSPSAYIAASKAGMLSADGRCKTFDKDANGYVRAEGVGSILLKPLHRAITDGDHIYAIIKGTAVNHGGHVNSLTVPNPKAQAEVIVEACQRANIEIDNINYIETHGTGTSLGDPIEINGLKKAFKTMADKQKNTLSNYYCGLGSLKTHIGHLEAAAGIASVIKVLLAIKHRTLPGNLHYNELNSYIELESTPFYIIDKTISWSRVNNKPLCAGISSFGFGGTNAHVIIEEYIENKTSIQDENNKPYLIALSAKTDDCLYRRIQDLYHWINNQEIKPSISTISYTLNLGRSHFNKRCIFIVNSITELQNLLKEKLKTKIYDISSIPDQEVSDDHYRNKLLELSKVYIEGGNINWEEVYHTKNSRISLPTYPFLKEKYWIPQIKSQAFSNDAEAETITTTHSLETLDRIQKEFLKHVSDISKVNVNDIDLTTTLTDLGFDSIAFKEFSVILEKKFKIEISPTLFFTYNSIEAISKYFLKEYAGLFTNYYNQNIAASKKSVIRLKKNIPDLQANISKNNNSDAVAIIGMNGYFPHSNNLYEFWKHLESGNDLVTEIPIERWDWRDYYGDSKKHSNKANSKWAACLDDVDKFDAAFFNLSAREANLMDPQQRLLMEVVWKTIEDAGYDPYSFSGKNVGLFAGVEFNDYQILMQENLKSFHGHLATGTSHAMIANRISYFLNLTGPSEVIDTACSSALVAIHHAVNSIRRGECSVALASGVSLMLNPETFVITSQLGALSPDGRCKTFDKSANGYVKGEGAAAILLKNAHQAQLDGDYIYGYIKGTSVNHGGKAQSLTAPNAATQSQLLINAYIQAAIDPSTVSYIEAHGTGTELGDPIEIEGLKLAFNTLLKNNEKTFCGIGSVKTNIGHLEPASGIAGVIKVLLSMQHEKIPGILHFKELNPYIDLTNTPFYIVNETKYWEKIKKDNEEIPRRAGVSSFGFGGTCAHVVIEESPFNSKLLQTQNKPYYLITLSAKNKNSLTQKMVELFSWIKTVNPNITLEALSYTLNHGRSHFNKRCALVVNSFSELENSLQSLIEGQQNSNVLMGDDALSTNTYGPLFTEIYKSTMENIANYKNLSAEIYREKLLLIADLYTKNYPIEWNLLHSHENNLRLAAIPTYPFTRQRYWFDAEETQPLNLVKDNLQEPSLPNIVDVELPQDLQNFTINYLQKIFAEKLRISEENVLINDTYETYGIDSLIGMEITNRLEENFENLPKTILYEKNTLTELAIFLNKKYKENLKKLYTQHVQFQPADSLTPFISENKDSTPLAITSSPSSRKLSEMEDDPIAIIGLSGTFPMANDMEEFWNNLINSRNCITEVPKERWNYKDFPVTVGGEEKYFKYGGFIPDVDKFDPLFFGIAPREAMLMDPQERLFLQNTWLTLEDAGYTRNKLKELADNNVGVFVGVTYNFYPLFIAEEWAKGNKLPLDIQMFSVANRVSYYLNFKGPSYIVDTACSSSLSAIHLAYESILRDECKMAIAGGVNLSLHPAKYHFLGGYNFLSDKGKCASFAEGGSGYVPSEGVGSILLKRLSQAIKDNDQIYGIIKSSSMNHGGKTSGYTVPNPNAQANLIKMALEKANINPRTVSYIEAHGTGTSLGDPIEIRGLQEAFEEYTSDKQFCAIGSVKSNIGHLEAAAGISQLAKVLMQIKYKQLVPSIHAETLNPFIDFASTPFYVQRELKDWLPENNVPRRAGLSSFGAGGTNVHIIIEEFAKESTTSSVINKPFIFILSAMNEERLHDYVQKYILFFEDFGKQISSEIEKNIWLKEVCFTLQVARENMPARLGILGNSRENILEKLKNYKSEQFKNEVWKNYNSPIQNIKQDVINDFINTKDYSKLIQVWVDGAKISWEKLYSNEIINIIKIPSYPFTKRRCWVTESNHVDTHPLTESEEKFSSDKQFDLANWLYQLQWEKKINANVNNISEGRWLIFSDLELGFLLQQQLGKSNSIYCFEADKFEELNKNTFYLDPNDYENYLKLFSHILGNDNTPLKGIIYLWSTLNEKEQIEKSTKLLFLFKAMIQQQWLNKIKFIFVTRGAQSVDEESSINIWQHYLGSLTRIFSAEQANFQTINIDLDSNKNLTNDLHNIINEIQKFNPDENTIAFRKNERFVIKLDRYSNQIGTKSWKAPEAVIITGGLGALGSEVAKWLALEGSKYFLLIGNSILPDKSEWNSIKDKQWKEKVETLTFLENQGVKVEYAAVDVSDVVKLKEIIDHTEQLWKKPIKGVFHLAGVTTDNITLDKMNEKILQEVFSAKVNGAIALHEIFNKPDLNCFVLFSSIAALPFFGMSGLSAYAMANEFIDGLAIYRKKLGLSSISINWAAWADKGMSHRYNHSHFLEAVGMSTIAIKDGIRILRHLLEISQENVIVFKIDWNKFLQVNSIAKKLTFFSNFTSELSINTPRIISENNFTEDQVYEIVNNVLAKLLQLEISEINSETLFQNYGLDSIIGINFVAELNAYFPDVISPMDLYKYPTIQQLVSYITQSTQTKPKVETLIKNKNAEVGDNFLLTEISDLSENDISNMIEDELKELDKLL